MKAKLVSIFRGNVWFDIVFIYSLSSYLANSTSLMIFLDSSILILEKSRSSAWSENLPKTMIYPNFDPKVISRAQIFELNNLKCPKILWDCHKVNNNKYSYFKIWNLVKLAYIQQKCETSPYSMATFINIYFMTISQYFWTF